MCTTNFPNSVCHVNCDVRQTTQDGAKYPSMILRGGFTLGAECCGPDLGVDRFSVDPWVAHAETSTLGVSGHSSSRRVAKDAAQRRRRWNVSEPAGLLFSGAGDLPLHRPDPCLANVHVSAIPEGSRRRAARPLRSSMAQRLWTTAM